MPEHQIKHKLVAQDFSGTGTPTQEQGLDSSEWNENHGTLVPGLGIEITSDGGSPPRYTFALTATSVASDLIPSIDDMFVVGTKSKRWRSGYFSRAVSVGATFAILPNDLKLTSGDLTITAPTLRLSSAGVQFLSISRLSSFDSQVPVFTSNSFMRFRVSDNVGMGVYQFNNDDDTNSLIIDAGFTEITPSVSGVWDLGFTNAFRIGKFTNELRLGASSEWQINSTTVNVLKFNLSFTEKARLDTSKFSTVAGVTVSAGGGFQTNATSTLGALVATTGVFNGLLTTQSIIPDINITRNIGSATFGYSLIFSSELRAPTGTDLILRTGSSSITLKLLSIVPNSDNSLDLGEAVTRWKHGFFSKVVSAGSGFVTGNVGRDPVSGTIYAAASVSCGSGFVTSSTAPLQWHRGGSFSVNNPPYFEINSWHFAPGDDGNFDLGKSDQRWRSIFFGTTLSGGALVVSGITNNGAFTQTGDFLPATDDLYNIGSPSRRWNNGFFAGTISVGTQGSAGYSFIGEHPDNPPNQNLWLFSKSGDITIDGAVTPIAIVNPQNDLRFDTNIAPLTDNIRSLSTAARRWTLLHLSSSLLISLSTDSAKRLNINNNGDGNITAESSAFGQANIFINASNSGVGQNALIGLSGTSAGATALALTVAPGDGTVRPGNTNNTFDLGAPINFDGSIGDRMWRGIYAATTMSFGGTTGKPGFATNTSAGMSFGGSSVANNANALGALNNKILVYINGVPKFIPVYDS